MEEKYVEVEVRVTFVTTVEVPDEIAHNKDLIDDFAQEFGSTEEALSTGDVEIDVLNYWYEDENGYIGRHI